MATTLQDGGSHGSYPAGQKPRPAPGTEIKAEVFREKEAASKAEKPPARASESQPRGY